MAWLYRLVLIEDIPKWEAKGWVLASNRVAASLGGWHSVYMRLAD